MKLFPLVFILGFEAVATSGLRAQSLTYMGDFGGGYSEATGINDLGQVVGYSNTKPGYFPQAFEYSNGVMSNLGSLGGGNSVSFAEAINNAGQIEGGSYLSPTGSANHAVLFTNGSVNDLGTIGGNFSAGYAINNSGVVTGTTENAQTIEIGFIYQNGVMSGLSPLIETAGGINDLGQVVGQSGSSGGKNFAYVDTNGTITNLGTLGGNNSGAVDVNNLGQVVGQSEISPNTSSAHAFLYSGGSMLDLGTLGGQFSFANAINDQGNVVGYSYMSSGGWDAFIYSSGKGMQDLNTLYASLLVSGTGAQVGYVSLTQATGINSSGEIVGDGVYWNGTSAITAGFLLQPAPVPEPTSAISVLLGLILIAFVSFSRSQQKRIR